MLQASANTPKNLESNTTELAKTDNRSEECKEDHKKHCTVCNVLVTGLQNFEQHLKGKKHIKNKNKQLEEMDKASKKADLPKIFRDSDKSQSYNKSSNNPSERKQNLKNSNSKNYSSGFHQHHSYSDYFRSGNHAFPNFHRNFNKPYQSSSYYNSPFQQDYRNYRNRYANNSYYYNYDYNPEVFVLPPGVPGYSYNVSNSAENESFEYCSEKQENLTNSSNYSQHTDTSTCKSTLSNNDETQNCPISEKGSTSLSGKFISSQRKNKVRKLTEKLIHSAQVKDSGHHDNADEKVKEQSSSLTDHVADRIARLVNPSNEKDKAAVSCLINRFAKSKKKQNLTRLKIQSDILNEANSSKNLQKNLEDVSNSCEEEVIDSDNQKSAVEDNALDSNAETSEKNDFSQNFKENKSNSSISCDLERNLTSKMKNKNKLSSKESNAKIKKKRTKSSVADCKVKRNKTSDVLSLDKISNTSHKNSSLDTTLLKSLQLQDSSLNLSNFQNSSFNLDKSISDPTANKNALPVKTEPLDPCNEQSTSTVSENGTNPISMSPVDSLINLFATGNVKLKQEFDDPFLDAIKSVDPNELVKACNNDTSMIQMSELVAKNFINQADMQQKKTAVTDSNSENVIRTSSDIKACISHSTKSDSLPLDSNQKTVSGSESSLECAENVKLHNQSRTSFLHAENATSLSQPQASIENLVRDLNELALLEADIKDKLSVADKKIIEYQRFLEEWKNKKLQYQAEEEDLRVKRNNVIQLMQELVGKKTQVSESLLGIDLSSGASNTKTPSSSVLGNNSTSRNSIDSQSGNENCTENARDSVSSKTDISGKVFNEKQAIDDELAADVCILSDFSKPPIPLIDLEADNKTPPSNTETNRSDMLTNIKNNKRIFDAESVTAHKTIVNFMQVHEDYLYTCSNDGTAKRFCLENITKTVSYFHAGKNVLQLYVDQLKDKLFLFTSCSDHTLSVFDAKVGVRVKSYLNASKINCICKGWNKCFAAFANGSVISFNLKDKQEIIKPGGEPLVSIATAYQGRVKVIVSLSVSGEISIRNAENGLLIRCLKEILKFPSHMSVYNDYAYFSSADKTISILNILTGQVEKKLILKSPITGLAVHENLIFTSTFSGVVHCYSTEVKDIRAYDGDGFNALTCLCVHQDWVFIGNRQGKVSVFKFNSSTAYKCQIDSCCFTFASIQQLSRHIKMYHQLKVTKNSTCPWYGCYLKIPPTWDENDRRSHIMNNHISRM